MHTASFAPPLAPSTPTSIRPARSATDRAARLDRIARRAHEIHAERGASGGRLTLTDWLQAEREIDSQS